MRHCGRPLTNNILGGGSREAAQLPRQAAESLKPDEGLRHVAWRNLVGLFC
jgi:hypothetical protein